MNPVRIAIFLPVLLVASCGTGDEAAEPAPPTRQTLNERFGGGGGRDPNSFTQGPDGKLKMNDAKRSQFENQGESHLSNKSFRKQDYKAGDYAKKSWWGNKEYGRQAYDGNTDGSRFQQTSRLDGQGADEAGSQARVPGDYSTGNYATGDTRESGDIRVRESDSTARESTRKNDQFQWDEERTLSVEQSRSILGH